MKLPKKNGFSVDHLISRAITSLWLWDMSRNRRKQTRETERQMRKRGLTYQELMQDEDYVNELVSKGKAIVIDTSKAPEFDILDCADHECTEEKHSCLAGRWKVKKDEEDD